MQIELSRRNFLKMSGAVGAAATLGLLSGAAASAQVTRSLDLTLQQSASRFLKQATLGPTLTEINEAALLGPELWIEAQFNKRIGYLKPLVDRYLEPFEEVEYVTFNWAWWKQVLEGEDPLRQRIAFALSEIFVISRRSDDLADSPGGIAHYYDMLLRNAFGNFRDLLMDVALHPCMGFYLSHVRNRKADPAANRFPDENFAREIMQLFSIGLFDLNQDGSQVLDGDGEPIPTYTNAEITEFAKVFTGLTYVGGDRSLDEFLYVEPDFEHEMVMYAPEHEPGEKRLLRGLTLSAGQNPMDDINDAIDNLFNHPNVGPFIGKLLIQRLVKSNPSPDYIARVAAAFNDDGRGERGNMKAVIRAILLDTEARDVQWMDDPAHGMLREPMVRYVNLLRSFNATSESGVLRDSGYYAMFALKQYPMFSPSVFNFFLPAYQPLGEIKDAGLTAPEFQITTSVSAVTTINFWLGMLFGESVLEVPQQNEEEPEEEEDSLAGLVYNDVVTLNLDIEHEKARDVDALLDHLDLLLTNGTLSGEMREVIRNIVVNIGDESEVEVRTLVAMYFILTSPDFAVLK